MKNITMDYETYLNEISEAKKQGVREFLEIDKDGIQSALDYITEKKTILMREDYSYMINSLKKVIAVLNESPEK